MERGIAHSKRADELRSKAASVGHGGISSDDPDAIDKLQERLAEPITSNDYHQLPVTDKQIAYARQIAARTGQVIPWEC